MKNKYLSAVLCAVLLLVGCSGKETGSVAQPETMAESDVFTQRERNSDYDENSTVIKLNDESITIDTEGTYILRGSLENGSVVIDTTKSSKVQLVLDGVEIHSESSAAIYIKQADKVFITLAENSENHLANGGSFENVDENNIDAVIFSKDDLCFNGNGRLTVDSPADHGIVSKDSLAITGGSYNITAASHGIACKEDIAIAGADFVIRSGKDGIHAENSDDSSLASIYIESGMFDIVSEGDGVSADCQLNIVDGRFSITSGGGSENGEEKSSDTFGGFAGGGRGPGYGGGGFGAPGMPMGQVQIAQDDESSTSTKALKAVGELRITGGEFFADAADDAIHSNTSVIIDGGNFDISTGDDAFHADDILTINGGCIKVSESYEGLEALHISVSGGDISVDADDDGINAAGGTDQSGMGGRGQDRFGPPGQSMNSDGSIVINGGKLYIRAGGDGIDANGTLEISGGDITVCTPTVGDTATMDYDVSATISGGSFIGTGAYGMAQTFDESPQGVVAASVGNCRAGTEIKLSDSAGNEILSYTPELDFAVVIISNSQIIKGESYTLSVGELSGEIMAY